MIVKGLDVAPPVSRVSCPQCRWATTRRLLDDGTWGVCPDCGETLTRYKTLAERRAEKARKDLANYAK